jgi:hypothetical protein
MVGLDAVAAWRGETPPYKLGRYAGNGFAVPVAISPPRGARGARWGWMRAPSYPPSGEGSRGACDVENLARLGLLA